MLGLFTAPVLRRPLTAVAALAAAGFATGAAAQEKVQFGYQYSLWGLPAVVAMETGVFKKHGLDIEGRRFGAGKDVRDALVAGSISVGTVGGTPFVVGAALGELAAIATVSYTGKSGCVVAGKNSGINTVADLKGKKVASRTGSTTDMVFRSKVLPGNNLDQKSVTIVNVNFPDHVSAVAGGSTDAFAGVEPTCAIAVAQGIGNYVVTFEKYDMLPNMLAATPDFIKKQPKAAAAFIKSMIEVDQMFKTDPKTVAGILAKIYAQNTALSEEVTYKLLDTIDTTPDYVPELAPYFQAQVDELVEQGRMPKTTVDWGKALNDSFLKAVRSGG